MGCDDFRDQLERLWEGDSSPEFRRHRAQCAECDRYARDMRLIRAGLRILKGEAPPEPSVGFAERLVRQLGQVGKPPSVGEFFELVGRRFVYGSLMLAFLMLLALALPKAGPVRGGAAADMLMPAQEAILLRPDPVLEIIPQETSDALPAEQPAAIQEGK
jgi:hypothetical protein